MNNLGIEETCSQKTRSCKKTKSVYKITGFPGGSDDKESACNAGDSGSIPGLGSSPEKEMATHCSIFAWEITWTEEPGRLQFMELQRVGHDWIYLKQTC